MAWLIIALGAALAVAGALSLGSGLPYMRIEWGWTEVIAGTTALSGGIVTIALGAVLLALASLRRVMQRGLASAPHIVAEDASMIPRLSAPEDVVPAEDPAAVLRQEQAVTPLESEPSLSDPQAAAPVLPDSHPPPELAVGEGLAREAETRPEMVKRRPLLTQLRDSWGGRRKSPADSVASPADPTLDAGVAPPALGEPESPAPFEGHREEQIAAPPSEVGRYEAGGASYALFSDGTIEVETDTGLHRFASMEELKAFIDQKDRAAAAPDR